MVRRIISETLLTSADPRLRGVILTRVDVSADLGHARLYYDRVELNLAPSSPEEKDKDKKEDNLEQALDHCCGYLRSQLASQMQTKKVPHLSFHIDMAARNQSELDEALRGMKS